MAAGSSAASCRAYIEASPVMSVSQALGIIFVPMMLMSVQTLTP